MRSSLKRLFSFAGLIGLTLGPAAASGQSSLLPRIAGHIGGDANGLAEQGGLIYWLMGPTLLTGRFNTTTEKIGVAGRTSVLAVEDDLVFLGFTDPANNHTGTLIVDAADPANPVELSSFGTSGLPSGIDVSSGYAYVMASGFPQLEVFDVRDPAHPQVPIFGGSELRLRGNPGDVAVVGSLAYLSTGPWGLRVADVRFLNQLEEVGDLATFEGLRIIDWREPSAPSYAGGVDIDGLGLGVAVSGTDLYLGLQDGNQGGWVRLFDATNPLAPVEKANVRVSGWAYDLEPRGDRLYAVTFFGESLELMKRETAPTNLVPAVRYSHAFLPSSVALEGDRAYMLTSRFATTSGEFHLLDISDPDTMAFVSSIRLPGSPFGIDAAGAYAYVPGLESGRPFHRHGPARARRLAFASRLTQHLVRGAFG